MGKLRLAGRRACRMNEPALRALAAGATVLAYGALCGAIFLRERRRSSRDAQRANLFAATSASAASAAGPTPTTLVLHASQNGHAEALAWRTARWLHDAGTAARVSPLDAADVRMLRDARQAFFIASTYGEGDAPDGASAFAEKVMAADLAPAALASLRYAVLALGDRQYAQFCAFGRRLDQWLQAAGAQRSFERIEVDDADPVSLAAWQARIGGAAEVDAPPDDARPAPPSGWCLVARTLLNPGSAGAPLYELAFRPSSHPSADWQSGDLARLLLKSDPGRPRNYSIASIATDGELQLLVRQQRHPDGRLGAASGFLTIGLQIGDTLQLQLRANRSFRLADNAQRPLILIGNGSGLAGLRSHLRARIGQGRGDQWLVFGERQGRHDFLCRSELEAWRQRGLLRIDRVFSREAVEPRYVQHRLLEAQAALREWVDRGAAIYVCGSRQGMAAGVDATLRQALGPSALDALSAAGRYRRDVY